MRSVIAVVVPVVAGAFAYAGLALGATLEGRPESLLVLLPAMLVCVLVVALIFLPLWSFLAHRTKRTRRAFVAVGAGVLLIACAICGAIGAFNRADGLENAGLLILPGMILIVTFGMLMDPRRVRGGLKSDEK